MAVEEADKKLGERLEHGTDREQGADREQGEQVTAGYREQRKQVHADREDLLEQQVEVEGLEDPGEGVRRTPEDSSKPLVR